MISFRVRGLILLLIHVAVATSNSVGPRTTFLPKNSVETPKTGSRNNLSDVRSASLESTFVETSNSLDKFHSIHTSRGGGVPTINGDEVKGAVIFTVLDYLFRKLFVKYGINFPSQLGGCCILFVAMVLSEIIKPGLGDSIFATLTPGANVLAKWLPVFFVPGLAMLPLAPSMGSPLEVCNNQ